MNIIFLILFIALVICDTALTYRVIDSGKGNEKAFARFYIKHPLATVIITAVALFVVVDLIFESRFYWLLGPLCLIFGFACWKSWRILHG